MELLHINTLGDLGEREVLRLVAAVESNTRHPLADSVAHAAGQAGVDVPASTLATTRPGEGVSATVEGRQVPLGQNCSGAMAVQN